MTKTLSRNDKHALLSAGIGAGVAVLGLLGRKAAVQAVTLAAGSWDRGLAAEHNATLALFAKLDAVGPDGHASRKMLLAKLKHALSKHAFQEENVIYPALRDAGMAEEADALTTDHGYVKQYLYDLADLTQDHPAFQDKLREFRRMIEDHMREEESDLFPRLKTCLDDEANKALTVRMNKEGVKLA